jgi:hypothetical protein
MWLFNLFLCFLLSGCGYTLQNRLKEVFNKKIYIPVFENQTDEIGAEQVFTNAIVREMLTHQEVLLDARDMNHLELRGVVKGISYSPTASTALGYSKNTSRPGLAAYRRIPSEMGVSVTVSLSLVDNSNNKVLWKKDYPGYRRVNMFVDRTSDSEAPSSAGYITQSMVETVYPDIARDMARDIYDDMVEIF